jgi:hypothetical protein
MWSKRLIGGITSSVGALGMLGMGIQVAERGVMQGNQIGGALICVLLLVSGASLLLSSRKAAQPVSTTTEAIEQRALLAAKKLGGRITANELATEAAIPLAAAEAELEDLHKRGACNLLIGESGVMVFHFPEFESAQAKQDIEVDDRARAAARARQAEKI